MNNDDAQRLIQRLLSDAKAFNQKTQKVSTPAELSNVFDFQPNPSARSTQDLQVFIDNYLKFASPTQSKVFMNQLWSKVEPASLVGEVLSAVTNTSMYTYEVAPVATMLEQSLIRHLTSLIWTSPGDGVMTSGGTASNLQGLMVARNERIAGAKSSGLFSMGERAFVLASREAHYSIKRACNLLGLGHESFIEVETDKQGIMTAQAVEDALLAVSAKNGRVLAVVATAGTTVKGVFDDLKGIGELCQKNEIWFHVDGAYGASVLLSPSHKSLMEG
ncbi:MAG: pyridoxal-dependent decarboxylase, partial [Pseudomonadota bacterium]